MMFYGNSKTVSMLTRFVEHQQLPQSVLLTGPDGVGKTTLALHLASFLLCSQRSDGASCGHCTVCKRIESKEHPEVAIIEPDGDITKIWQLWTRSGHAPGALDALSYRPVLGSWRIVIITAAHTLNDESANSILKVLEEPPPYVQFFLCSTSQSAVLPTIASRCFSVPVPPLTTQTISTILTTRLNVDPEMALVIAKGSAGCLGRAIRAVEDHDVTGLRDRATVWVSDFLSGNRLHIYGYAESLRNIVPKLGTDSSTRTLVTRGLQAVADAFGRRMTLEPNRLEHLMECVDNTMLAAYSIQRNGNPQLVTDALVSRLARICHRK